MHFKGTGLSNKSVKNGGIKIVLHTYIENTKIKIICTFSVTSSITVVTKAVQTEEFNAAYFASKKNSKFLGWAKCLK